jgi:hypothetical protein
MMHPKRIIPEPLKNHLMRNYFTVLVLTMTLVANLSAQDYLLEGKSVSNVFEVKNKSQEALYQDILTYFGDEENAELFTIASENKEEGSIKLEQNTQVFYRNIGKLMYPNRSGMAELLSAEFIYNHEITVSEGAYMVRSELIAMNKEMYGHDDLFFDCLDFERINEDKLDAYNRSMDKLLKMNVVFKGRRQVFMDNSKSQFEDASQNILSGIMSDMGDLYNHLVNEDVGMR